MGNSGRSSGFGLRARRSSCSPSPHLPLHRTLYEEEEQESFHESLAVRIKSHEKDIEKMCNKNYQGFIESVSELLKVRTDAAKLKVSVWHL